MAEDFLYRGSDALDTTAILTAPHAHGLHLPVVAGEAIERLIIVARARLARIAGCRGPALTS
jgi:hypothetical protein